jgi:ureidoglycolate dehydrogenase (NAD+)
MTEIHLYHDHLSAFVTAIFQAKGMNAADAASVADVLIWANLRGIDSHGVNRVASYIEAIDRGWIDPRARPVARTLTPSCVVSDCAQSAGAVAMMQAAETARAAAASSGVAIGLVSATTHTGAIGRYAEWLAERGCAAIVFVGGRPFMAYHGARTTSLSTAPLAIAVPGPDPEPLLLDMASSMVAAGRLRNLAAAGQTIPEGWALDEFGKPTTDAARAAVVLPLGGAKGSSLAFMFECLTGILAATPVLSALAAMPSRAHIQNGTVIAIDIETFRPLAEFRRDIAALTAQIKSLPRQDGFAEILLPGERGRAEARRRRAAGIPLDVEVWRDLCRLAENLGIAAPEVIV